MSFRHYPVVECLSSIRCFMNELFLISSLMLKFTYPKVLNPRVIIQPLL